MTSSQILKNKLAKKYKGSKKTKAYQVVLDLLNMTNRTMVLPLNWEKAATSKYIEIEPAKSLLGITGLLTAIGVAFILEDNKIKILTDIDYTR